MAAPGGGSAKPPAPLRLVRSCCASITACINPPTQPAPGFGARQPGHWRRWPRPGLPLGPSHPPSCARDARHSVGAGPRPAFGAETQLALGANHWSRRECDPSPGRTAGTLKEALPRRRTLFSAGYPWSATAAVMLSASSNTTALLLPRSRPTDHPSPTPRSGRCPATAPAHSPGRPAGCIQPALHCAGRQISSARSLPHPRAATAASALGAPSRNAGSRPSAATTSHVLPVIHSRPMHLPGIPTAPHQQRRLFRIRTATGLTQWRCTRTVSRRSKNHGRRR